MKSGKMVALAWLALLAPGMATAAKPPVPVATSDVYHLGPGDKLRITVYNEPALTGEYSVSSTGAISFPLIGEVPARDASTDEFQAALTARLGAGYVKDPRVSVEVLNYRPYYILGEVAKPGEYPFSVGLDVVQAVAAAGGYTYRANRGKVMLRRKGDPVERSINIKRQSPPVLPGDTIRIGERYF